MTQEEEISEQKERLREALERLNAVEAENQALQEQLAAAHKRIEELEKQQTPPPAFVKANVVKTKAQKPRKKRKAEQNGVRRREAPTQIVEHRVVNCPTCHLRLGGISLARVRQVIDVPAPSPVEVTEHHIYKGWCAGCGKWHEAPVDFHEQVLGQGRLGVRLASIIAYLHTVMRLPIRQIRDYLLSLHGLRVSVGEIVELLHRIKQHTQPALDALKAKIRASPAVQADETGWREDGSNGVLATCHIRPQNEALRMLSSSLAPCRFPRWRVESVCIHLFIFKQKGIVHCAWSSYLHQANDKHVPPVAPAPLRRLDQTIQFLSHMRNRG